MISNNLLSLIPEKVARKYKVIPMELNNDILTVEGIKYDFHTIQDLNIITRKKIKFKECSKEQIIKEIESIYGNNVEVNEDYAYRIFEYILEKAVTEKRLPQDGRAEMNIRDRLIDIRTSTIPTTYGEKTVLRILNRDNFFKTKEEIGFSNEAIKIINEMISNKSGIVLIVGETGCGKSTTMYSLLNDLNNISRNIITVEDPVEYKMEGINQIQVNTKVGLTFEKGLRAILRQDPDVIMIGEIRDSETAKIAIRSSITGHLVLSTLHTNDTVASITRLKDMGIDLYLISASLVGVISQRLVRKVCPKCSGIKYDCDYCSGKGYLGRTIVYEILQVDDEIRECIRNLDRHKEIREIAIERGKMITFEDSYISISQRALAENI